MSDHELEELYHPLDSRDPQERLGAARRLVDLGQAGARVLVRALTEYPWLQQINLLTDTDQYRIGTGQKSELIPNDQAPFHAIQALADIGREAIPGILCLLRHEEPRTLYAGVIALQLMDNPTLRGIPDLRDLLARMCELLVSRESLIAQPVLWLFKRIADRAAPAVPILVAMYHQLQGSPLRKALVETLIYLHAPAEVMADVVVDFVNGSDMDVQQEVFSMIGPSHIRSNAAPLAPLMLAYLRQYGNAQTPDPFIDARRVAEALGGIGEAAREAILELARDPDEQIRDLAFRAIEVYPEDEDGRAFARLLLDRVEPQFAAGRDSSSEVNRLRKIQKTHGLYPDDEARWSAMQQRLVEKWGSVEFADELIRDLHSRDDKVVFQAACKAREIQNYHEEVALYLLEAMLADRRDTSIAYSCKETLKRFAPRITSLAPELIAVMMENKQTRYHYHSKSVLAGYAAEILMAMGSSFAPQVALLLAGPLTHPAGEVRRAALEVLGATGPAMLDYAPGLIAAMVERLNEPDEEVAQAAIQALGAMGAASRPALPDLMRAARANSVEIVSAAKETLAKFIQADRGAEA